MRTNKIRHEIEPFVKAMNERGCDMSEIVESVLGMGYPTIAEGSTIVEIVVGILEPKIQEVQETETDYYVEVAKLPRVQKLLVDFLWEGFITAGMSRDEIVAKHHIEPDSKNNFTDDDLKKAVEFFKKYEAIN